MSINPFYVLHGLLNGERGVAAITTSGHPMADGHYFLRDDETDPSHFGFFKSRDDAMEAGLKTERTQTWLFPLDGYAPYQWEGDPSEVPTDGTNVASIEELDDDGPKGHFECRVEGSYETLTLRVSVPNHAAAAMVFAACLLAQTPYV